MKKPITETPLTELEARAKKLDQHSISTLGKRKQAQKQAHFFALLLQEKKVIA